MPQPRRLLLASLLFLQRGLCAASPNAIQSVYDWEKVPTVSPSSNKIRWTPCFGEDYLCTRFEVPLDWADENVGTTQVAFVKYPSKNESAEDMLINFGGPGGSGVGTLMPLAPLLAEMFGSGVNLISFDPRGVNNTGPSLSCFPDEPSTKRVFESVYCRTISDDVSDSAATQFYMAEALGKWCNPVLGGPNGTAKYVNTPSIAHDLLSFAELLSADKGKPKDEAKLWYTGFSYGTVLGTTFAALYPDRIGRLILDGVEDGEDYYTGGWSNNLIDADAVVKEMISSCFVAGPDDCPLHENTTELIAWRMSNILTKLQENPIPVANSSVVDMPVLATYADWANVLLLGSYFPLGSFPKLVQILTDLERGYGDSLMAARKLVFGCHCNEDLGYSSALSNTMIQCVDAGGKHNISSLEEYREYSNFLKRQSKYVGDAWAMNAGSCRMLDVTPPESGQFRGPLPPQANQTSFPLLFIGNKADPVTPLANARRAATLFPGSGLIELDAPGHTSMAAPSECTFKHIQSYLAGLPPPPIVTCQPNEILFKSSLKGLAGLTEI